MNERNTEERERERELETVVAFTFVSKGYLSAIQ
jgi:hypothetical protein